MSTENSSIPIPYFSLYCEQVGRVVPTKSIFHGEDPLQFSLPILLLQIALLNLISATLQFFFKPFRQLTFVPQILGGIILGPSFLGHYEILGKKLFSQKATMVLDVFEMLGFMFLSFMVAVRIDMGILKKTGKLGFIIGVTSFIVPVIITVILSFFLRSNFILEKNLHRSLPMIASFESITSFLSISILLVDLKLLNSELGRLALSSSFISSITCALLTIIVINVERGSRAGLMNLVIVSNLCNILMIITIFFFHRPIMFWMIKQTPEGKTLKETHVCAIILMLLGCVLFGEFTGSHYVFGSIIFGLAVPAGEPLGSSLANKLDCFVSVVLMPCYIFNVGRKVNVFLIGFKSFLVVEFIGLVAVLAKFVAVIVPSMYFKLSYRDAFSLGILLNYQGFYNIQIFDRAWHYKLIDENSFITMVIMTVVHSAAFIPLVRTLYDPSRRYTSCRRQTIKQSTRGAEFRVLACLHGQDDVPSIINILESSNPTRDSPIAIYVLNLVELVGSSSPQLIHHQFYQIPSPKPTRINTIIKAFERFELYKQGMVTIQCFTAIAPYATMHNDICTLALDKSTSLVIIPFRKSDSRSLRKVNKNVLEMAPCSVGILILPEMVSNSSSILSRRFYFNVCALFLGGPDDREALAYAARMAEHPSIRLTVLQMVHSTSYLIEDRRLDTDAINNFNMSTFNNNCVVYKEETVRDVTGTIKVLGSLVGSDYDLILVGRRHDTDSPLLEGLATWREIEELGIIGDMLGSSDFGCKASVLVVQQQASVGKKWLKVQDVIISKQITDDIVQLP